MFPFPKQILLRRRTIPVLIEKKGFFMKKIIFVLMLSSIFSLNAEISDAAKKFIKGNIHDKTDAVKEAEGKDGAVLSARSIDFVLENAENFENDRDFSALALASVLKLPKDYSQKENDFPGITEKLIKLFTDFNDETVRVAVAEKLEAVQNPQEKTQTVALFNSYLKNLDEKSKKSAVTAQIIKSLGKTGDSESFILVYEIWKLKQCASFTAEVEKSLLGLTSSHIREALNLVAGMSAGDIGDFFNLVKNSSEIRQEIKAEIAESVLSATINNTEGNSETSVQTVLLQTDALQLLAASAWTRGASLAVKYFLTAKDQFKNNFMSEDQFLKVISCVTELSSPEAAPALSNYLAEMNSLAEKNSFAARNVVLAVINSLGALGDKTAFDNLLYVTYLNYPEEIKNAARSSLAKLKW